MGQLTNQFVSQSYQGLLNLANANTGFTANLQTITDGLGGSSPLQISQTQVNISGTFTVNGAPVSVDTGSLVTTSSFNAFTSSVDLRFDGIELETGSLQNQINQKLNTGSFNAYTSSNDSKVNSLIAGTGSYATTSSLTAVSQSIAGTDLAQNNRLTAIESITGSLATTGSLNSYTLTSSFNSYTSSNDSKVNSLISATGSYATTSSLNSLSQSIATTDLGQDNRLGSLESKTGSYATTGSNNFVGQQNINGSVNVTGSLNVTGEITALSASITYLETIYQTSSVIFSSGSNILGDAAGDTQTLYGTVNLPNGPLVITGSVTASAGFNGNLTGTASYATNALSASHAVNSDTTISSSFSQAAISSSFAQNAISSSHSVNSDTSISSSFATNAVSSSHSVNSDNSISSSFAQNAVSSSHSVNSDTSISSSFAQNAVSASYAPVSINTGSFATTGSNVFIGNQTLTGSFNQTGSMSVIGNPSNPSATIARFGDPSYGVVDISGNGQLTATNAVKLTQIENWNTVGTSAITVVNTLGDIYLTPKTATGSVVIGQNQSHKAIVTGSLDVRNGDLELNSNNTTVNIDLYLTSSQAGQSNIIKGWWDNPNAGGAGTTQANYTGSLRITGSNNTVSMPQLRATAVGGGADMQGYISGSDNTIASNGSGIFLNTGSLLFPKTSNNYLGHNSNILMNFTTSSLLGGHPQFNNNTLYAGGININSNSGSIGVSGNLINGGSITSNQNFVTNTRAVISANYINQNTTLNHISSSIIYNNNLVNSTLTVNNHLSSSALAAGNTVTMQNNAVFGGSSSTGVGLWVSGSQSTQASRNIVDNLIGGKNIIISSSFVSSSNSSLAATVVYGQGLTVNGNVGTGTAAGGGAFFGRFNDTGSLSLTNDIVFAVGTGTAAATRRTGLYITSGSLVGVSGSLDVKGVTNALVVTGSQTIQHSVAGQSALTVIAQASGQPAVSITGSLNVSGSGDHTIIGNTLRVTGQTQMSGNSDFPLYVSGTIQSQRIHFDGNPFNTLPAYTLGAIRMAADNETLQYTNYNKAEITTQSFIDQYVNTGSLTTQTRLGARYAGTEVKIETINNNGTRSVNVISDRTTITGSLAVTGDVQFASGSNKTMGTFVLDGGNPGVATVSNSLVSANSLIFLTKQTNVHSGNGTVSVTSKGTGTFSVTSNHNGDTDTVAYLIINPS